MKSDQTSGDNEFRTLSVDSEIDKGQLATLFRRVGAGKYTSSRSCSRLFGKHIILGAFTTNELTAACLIRQEETPVIYAVATQAHNLNEAFRFSGTIPQLLKYACSLANIQRSQEAILRIVGGSALFGLASNERGFRSAGIIRDPLFATKTEEEIYRGLPGPCESPRQGEILFA